MSRAFVREDDGAATELELPVDTREAPVTAQGYARLQSRLAELERIPGEARAARQLMRRLEHVRVVAAAPAARDRVAFGARVTVEDEDGTSQVFAIVGPDETSFFPGAVSVASPVGRALLGALVGDAVRLVRPKGAREVVVTAIDYDDASP